MTKKTILKQTIEAFELNEFKFEVVEEETNYVEALNVIEIIFEDQLLNLLIEKGHDIGLGYEKCFDIKQFSDRFDGVACIGDKLSLLDGGGYLYSLECVNLQTLARILDYYTKSNN
ncbi:hypothetical protein AGMMS49982_11620 [Bacteroidia bacterium]|nr:hypothetical protein AGMMS49982_11620 [Bacteroidia bacterium]